jgi:hypothetical protein
MKSRISVFVVLSCLCVTSQNLTSNDQEKLDEMIFAQGQLKENDRNEWFLFETYDGASMYFNGKGVLQLNLKKRFDWADAFYGADFAKVSKNNRLGFINKQGEVVVPLDYENVKVFSNGLAAVMMLGKHGFIDTAGTLVIPPIYEDAGYFGDGLAPVKKNGKFGFIDRKGTLVIPYTYFESYSFYNGRAAVQLDQDQDMETEESGKWGFIDVTGELIITYTYSEVSSFTPDGTAKVIIQNGSLLGDNHHIDKNGKRL